MTNQETAAFATGAKVPSTLTDEEYEQLKRDNVAKFKQLSMKENLSGMAKYAYFLLLGICIGFLYGGGCR